MGKCAALMDDNLGQLRNTRVEYFYLSTKKHKKAETKKSIYECFGDFQFVCELLKTYQKE